MKKSFFLMAIILSLFMISCGSTKNVAGNENPLPAASPAENSQPAASPADTDNAVSDSESKADSEKEKKESETPLEIVSQEDVIQSKPLEDEKEPASTHIEEPQILDAPPAETEPLPEFNPNAEHSLAENKPEAVGTTFANPAEKETDSQITEESSTDRVIQETSSPAEKASAEENQKPSLASQTAPAENENPASAGSQTASSATSSASSPADPPYPAGSGPDFRWSASPRRRPPRTAGSPRSRCAPPDPSPHPLMCCLSPASGRFPGIPS